MAEPTTTRSTTPAGESSTPPALGSTADLTPYVAVSWLAVAAVGVAILFVLILLFAGYGAVKARRPLMIDWLLLLPVATIVLSFAARRVVRNAEGTRTGELFGIDLPGIAWWTGLILGLGYAAYMLAIQYSIRREAENEVRRWGAYIENADDKEALARAFYRTREPNQRASMSPDNTTDMEKRWRTDFIGFRQCDLIRLVRRNPKGCKFEVGGLRDWAERSGSIECSVSATMTCPEGTFPVQVTLRGVEAIAGESASGRQWQVGFSATGFVQREQIRLNPFGWAMNHLEESGDKFARAFIQLSAAREARVIAFLNFTQSPEEPIFAQYTPAGVIARSAALGATPGLVWTPGAADFEITAARLFKLPGGGEPSAEQKKTFATVWGTLGLSRAGDRLRDNAERFNTVVITDTAVEIGVPVEIPLPIARNEATTAQGRVIVVCTDPSVLAEVKKARGLADPAHETSTPPEEFQRKQIPWKLVRVESDLIPVQAPANRPTRGGPGGEPPG